MAIRKEIIMKVVVYVDKGGYVNAKIKGKEKQYNISMREGILTTEDHARLMFNGVMREIFDGEVLGIIKETKKK